MITPLEEKKKKKKEKATFHSLFRQKNRGVTSDQPRELLIGDCEIQLYFSIHWLYFAIIHFDW